MYWVIAKKVTHIFVDCMKARYSERDGNNGMAEI
jgi:hypothetical protein